jgi:hypothetical protein
MYQPVIVHKNRTNVIVVKLGINVSADTLTSEIRARDTADSLLLATWAVSFVTDGTDGELRLTLDNSLTAPIKATTGFMDIKRVTGGEPISVFGRSLPVTFVETITQ